MFNKMVRSVNYRIARIFQRWVKPRMFYYRKNFQGLPCHNLRIGSTTFIDSESKLYLSDHVYIGHHNFIEASNEIHIEKGCQITSYVSITTHSSHISIRLYGEAYSEHTNHLGYITGSIEIGEYSFVGPHVVIMPNTKIGKGCLVTAYSYVKGHFPDGSIISGNPAQVVGNVLSIDQDFLDKHPELNKCYLK